MTTFRTLITGTAVAALVAGSAFAQSATPSDSDAAPLVTQPGAVAPQAPAADQGADTAEAGDSVTPMQDESTTTAETADPLPENGDVAETAPVMPEAGESETAEGGADIVPMETDSNETADANEAMPMTSEGAETPPLAAENTEEPLVPEVDNPFTEADNGPLTVAEVVGMNVIGAENESVGEIDYVVQQGNELGAVIGIGGFLGLGEYTVLLPIDRFEVVDDGNLRLASLTREQLKEMPEIDESSLEPLPDDMVVGNDF